MLESENRQFAPDSSKSRRNPDSSGTSVTIAHQVSSALTENKLSAQDVIKLILRYKLTILLFAIFGSMLGWFYANSKSPIFYSTATLSIKTPSSTNDNKNKKEEASSESILISSSLKNFKLADSILTNNERGKEFAKYLKFGLPGGKQSKGIIDKFMEQIGTLLPEDDLLTASEIEIAKKTGSYNQPIHILKSYQSLLDFDYKEASNLLEITAKSQDHILSANIANIHSKQFINFLREKQNEALNENTKFLRQRVEEAASRLAQAENKLLEFAKVNNFVLSSEEQTNNKFLNMSSQLNEVLLERAELEGLLAEARATRGRSALGETSAEISEMSFQLRQKQKEYSSLLDRTSLNRKSPRLIELRREIRESRDLIRNRRSESISVLEARARAARNKEDILRKEIEKAKSEGFAQSKNQIEYSMLETRVNSLKTLHTELTKELENANANEENSQINAVLAAAATPSSSKFERHTGFLMILGFICGIICGIGVSYSQDALDDTIRTAEDLEKALKIKSLGVLPKLTKGQGGLPSGSYNTLDVINPDNPEESHIQEQSDQIINLDHKDLVMVKRPRSAESEAVRSIRTSIMLSSIDNPPKVMLVTSGKQSEGKTTLSSNLAISFAQDGNRTLVLDADLRRPGLSTLFSVPENTPGLAHVLMGQNTLEDALQLTEITNFYVLPVGLIPPNPAELLNSQKMIALINTLRAHFDTIIIDGPPVLPVTDSLILSRLVDGIVLVVRAEKTVKEIPQQAVKRLDQVQANILGLIANGVDTRKNYYYSGYYKDVYSYYGTPKKKSFLFSKKS